MVVGIFAAAKLPPWWAVPVIWRLTAIGNTAYRQSVTAERRKTAYHQHITAVLHYRRKIPPYFGSTASAKTSTANSRYRQKVRQLSIPLKRYHQRWIPPKRYRRHWISPKRYRRYWIPPRRYRVHAQNVACTLDTAQKLPASLSCSFFVLCSFWFLGFLFGRTSLWTCVQRDAPASAHIPARTPAHTTLSVVQ